MTNASFYLSSDKRIENQNAGGNLAKDNQRERI